VFYLAPTHLGWDTQRQFYSSVQGPPGVETPTLIFIDLGVDEDDNQRLVRAFVERLAGATRTSRTPPSNIWTSSLVNSFVRAITIQRHHVGTDIEAG
jgi:alpha-D-ribose 1-methylphosphonate 5-phosphate C-P lyase